LVPRDESGFEREAFCYVAEVHREFLAALDNITVVDFRDKVSSSGSGAGFATSSHRGTTSKGTKVSNF
jgi:ATP-dependent protease HslVU (ClpYQ) peptidase subunit